MLDKTSLLTVTSATLDRYEQKVYDKAINLQVARKYQLDVECSEDSTLIEFPEILFPEIAAFSSSAVA